MKILVVEDEKELRRAVADVFADADYEVEAVGDGNEALFQADLGIYDLLVLDIMLPGLSGLDIVQLLRAKGNFVPVLFLTARDSVEDRVRGLNLGGDDYLVKPFAIDELLARVKALLRRKDGRRQDALSYCGLTLRTKEKEAYYQEQPLGLTGKEYDLLEYLLLNCERILTRDQIMDRLWGYDSESGSGIVDVYIYHLRKKLQQVGAPVHIRTIRSVGYMLAQETRAERAAAGGRPGKNGDADV